MVNVFAYQDWQGIDRDGKTITKTIFRARLNWGKSQSYECYMDAEHLHTTFSGIIYYTLKDDNQLIRPVALFLHSKRQ